MFPLTYPKVLKDDRRVLLWVPNMVGRGTFAIVQHKPDVFVQWQKSEPICHTQTKNRYQPHITSQNQILCIVNYCAVP